MMRGLSSFIVLVLFLVVFPYCCIRENQTKNDFEITYSVQVIYLNGDTCIVDKSQVFSGGYNSLWLNDSGCLTYTVGRGRKGTITCGIRSYKLLTKEIKRLN